MAISIVQHGSNSAAYTTGSSATLAVTLGSPVTAGNCLVANIWIPIAPQGVGFSGTVTGVTSNGAADNWYMGYIVQDDSPNTVTVWVDPNTAGGFTVIDIPFAFNATASTTNGIAIIADVY